MTATPPQMLLGQRCQQVLPGRWAYPRKLRGAWPIFISARRTGIFQGRVRINVSFDFRVQPGCSESTVNNFSVEYNEELVHVQYHITDGLMQIAYD